MESELQSLIKGSDNAFIIQNLMGEITGTLIQIEVYVDSRTALEVVAKQGRSTEKRLQIDIHS